MKRIYDLAALPWLLVGLTPNHRLFVPFEDVRDLRAPEVLPQPARVPGSVQAALLAAGLLPDWNVGLNHRACEWVEHRHWLYQADLPDGWFEEGSCFRLNCAGLDYCGRVYLNGKEAGTFAGTVVPHRFDLTSHLRANGNILQILFELPPRWLGMYNRTSQIHEWKPRFYYTWDWQPRVVQTGIWDSLAIEAGDGAEIEALNTYTDAEPDTGRGVMFVQGKASGAGRVEITLRGEQGIVQSACFGAARFAAGITWRDLPVGLWWPNREGPQPLYTLTCRLTGPSGEVQDEQQRTVGFKHVEWRACRGAPAGADPWLCVVNGRPIFLQGVNWTPVRPNFADVTEQEYRIRLEQYRDLGCNVLRVWGGGILEKEAFYRLCDEMGLLVWQEFPLSSSAYENWPPEAPDVIEELVAIAASYISQRQYHVSLLLWCGGNELQGNLSGEKVGMGKPVDLGHPLMQRFAGIVAAIDPTRRFLPSSPSGPRAWADAAEYGKGLHWDVHGPWSRRGSIGEWAQYWQDDDSLFRSEVGSPGAQPVDLTRRYKGDFAEVPGTQANEFWRLSSWWIEWPIFVQEMGREPASLDEYVRWSQARQAEALEIAVRACKGRFPACGGFIVWMGHDAFPCAANTAILDFNGRPKPAALALARVFRGESERP
jgi:beta-mannosidase